MATQICSRWPSFCGLKVLLNTSINNTTDFVSSVVICKNETQPGNATAMGAGGIGLNPAIQIIFFKERPHEDRSFLSLGHQLQIIEHVDKELSSVMILDNL